MNKLNLLILFVFPLIILLAIVIPTRVAVAETANNNDDEMIPTKIAERLLRLNRVDFYRGIKSNIIVGKLPDNLPVEIPQPGDTKVIGSIQRGENIYDIALDIPVAAAQVKSFYENQLIEKEWKQQEDISPKRAFATSATEFEENLSFCKSEKGPLLQLNINQPENTPTEVGMSLNTNESDSSCRFLVKGLSFSFAKTPILKPPANTKVTPKQVGGFSSEMSNSMANLESQRNLQQLNQHYTSQMQQAGWTKMADTQNNQAAFSMWSLKDKDNIYWQGMMSIKPVEGKSEQYLANLILIQEK